jgi:hypothetical protein
MRLTPLLDLASFSVTAGSGVFVWIPMNSACKQAYKGNNYMLADSTCNMLAVHVCCLCEVICD